MNVCLLWFDKMEFQLFSIFIERSEEYFDLYGRLDYGMRLAIEWYDLSVGGLSVKKLFQLRSRRVQSPPPRRLNPEIYLLKKKSNPGAAKWLTEVIFMAVRTFIGTIR